MRKTSLLLLGAVSGAAMTVFAIQSPALLLGTSAKAAAADTYRQLNLFGDIFERVRSHYVEKPDESKLVETAINGMLNGLDPHSSFMAAKEFRDMQVQTRGEFGGLGIEVTMEDGLVKVVAPIDETPAAKAGVRAGDIITHLDDEAVQGLTLNQAVEKMRGPVNTKIRLKVMRKNVEKPVELSITRDVIRVRSVRSRIEGDDIGYVRITQFNEQTTDGLRKAMNDFATQIPADKLRGYIIDLRNNPGGLLDQAISVSDTFLDRGEIVSTRGRDPEETQRFSARAWPDRASSTPGCCWISGCCSPTSWWAGWCRCDSCCSRPSARSGCSRICWCCARRWRAGLGFPVAQTLATLFAILGNFLLNNEITFRDQRLSGAGWLRGALVFVLVCGLGAAAQVNIAFVLLQDGQRNAGSWARP